uniref:Uncharacterized protein n=1 Tax=Panagrolaimus davidi TaxID=227884 RepID=A0A914PLH4_9BILA
MTLLKPGGAITLLAKFDERAGNIFGKRFNKSSYQMKCFYESRPSETEPKVQCRQGGQCITGKAYDEKKYPTVECSECVDFQCGDDERLMAGEGCLEDFERICKNVPADDMQKIKANRKNYFYYGENYMMTSCSYKDDCHEEEHKKYLRSMPDKFEMFFKKWYTKPDKVCKYEPLPKPEPSKRNENGSSKYEPLKQDENGANGIKLFGMFIFGYILFYLL